MKRLVYIAVLAALVLPGGGVAQGQRIVKVSPGFATVVVCPAPPELVTVGNMDDFSVQSAGNYVLIKPLVGQGTTNMFIKAGKETYNMILQIADSPDVEVRLDAPAPVELLAKSDPAALPGSNGHSEDDWQDDLLPRRQTRTASEIPPEVRVLLDTRFKPDDRYTHSVASSGVIFAIDHMKQMRDRLFVIGTIVNHSSIPYDIGLVQFTLIDYHRSYLFWRKKLREQDIEPAREYFTSPILPGTSGRLLFIFEKYGYPRDSTLRIKCSEESGRRDLLLEVPGAMIE